MTSSKFEPCQRFEGGGLCVSGPFIDWRENVKPGKRVRNYIHVDEPLDLDLQEDFEKTVRTIESLKDYQFLPFIRRDNREIRFRKNKEGRAVRSLKIRPIMYAAHQDAHIYSFYNFLISQKYEKWLVDSKLGDIVIAYRKSKIDNTDKGKSNIHFANEAFSYIKQRNDVVVITHDIEHFFDELDHKILKNRICNILGDKQLDDSLYKVFRSLTRHRHITHADFIQKKFKRILRRSQDPVYKILKGHINENESGKGIPQGSPISGLLANIYLMNFDLAIRSNFPNVYYRRYSDDLIFVCTKDEKESLLKFIDQKVNEHRLSINPDKSFICYFHSASQGAICELVTDGSGRNKNRDYLSYLGFDFDGNKILFRKNTFQKLKHRQIERAKRQRNNTVRQIRKKPRRNIPSDKKHRNNYFKRALQVMDDTGIKRQVLKVSRDRNNS